MRRCVVQQHQQNAMLTPVFLFFLLNVHYTWHIIHHVKGPSLRNSGSGIPDPEFRSKVILPWECWNDLIPMCVPPESGNSAENQEFRKMRTGINRNTGRNAQPSSRLICTIHIPHPSYHRTRIFTLDLCGNRSGGAKPRFSASWGVGTEVPDSHGFIGMNSWFCPTERPIELICWIF